MKTKQITVYDFEALSKSAQQKVLDNRFDIMDDFLQDVSDDYRRTLKKFCWLMDVTMKSYEADYCGSYYKFEVSDEYYYLDYNISPFYGHRIHLKEYRGEMLVRYLRNNVMSIFYPSKVFNLYKKDENGRYIISNARTSRIIREFEYNPLTGYGVDWDILQPIVEFMQHPDDTTTYQDLIDECLSAFFKEWKSEFDVIDDDDAVIEEVQNRGWLFFESGKRYIA